MTPSPLDDLTDSGSTRAQRVAALRRLVRSQGASLARVDGLRQAVERAAPGLSARTLPELRNAYGADGAELADALVRDATRVSAAIGAAAGALATASEAAPVALVSAPVQLGAASLAVVAVELRLVAELHAALGRPLPPGGAARGAALLQSWATGRGVSVADLAAGGGARSLFGAAAQRRLTRRLTRRFLRSTVGFVPVLVGAAAGAAVNARGTRRLGTSLRDDLLSGQAGRGAARRRPSSGA